MGRGAVVITWRDHWWLGVLMMFFGTATDRPTLAWIGLAGAALAGLADKLTSGRKASTRKPENRQDAPDGGGR